MKKLGRLLLPIVIAVALGPLIAGLMFWLLAVFNEVFDTLVSNRTGPIPVADLFELFGLFILVAYFEGGAIALLAGALVSIWMIWRPPGLVVAIVAAVAAIGLVRLSAELGFLSASGILVRNNLAPALVVAVIAAAVCWLLMRRFARTA